MRHRRQIKTRQQLQFAHPVLKGYHRGIVKNTSSSTESPSGNRPAGQPSGRRVVAVFIVSAIVLVLAAFVYWARTPSTDELLRAGRQALARNDFRSAADFARQILDIDTSSKPAMFLAAESARRAGRFEEALAQYEKIPDDATAEAVRARVTAGEILLQQQKRLTPAERQFRRALAQDPDNVLAIDRLAFLLSLEARNWEAQPYQLALIRRGAVSPRRLYLLCLNDLVHADAQQVRTYYQADPHDVGALLALAERALAERNYERTERLLREALRGTPRLIEAQLKLGRVLLSTGRKQAFLHWHATLPERAEDYADVWVLRGRFAADNGEDGVAARCYGEAVRRDPCRQQAVYGFGQALAALHRRVEAEPYLRRARQLLQYSNAVYDARSDRPRLVPKKAYTAAKRAAVVGLRWEALAWKFLAEHGYRVLSAETVANWKSMIPPDMPSSRIQPEFRIVSGIDLSTFPLPRWSDAGTIASSRSTLKVSQTSVTFEDQAVNSGIVFRYRNAANPGIVGLGRVYQFTGGGVAAIDFDRDGWPDLYFTQGSGQRPQQEQSGVLDRLFQNRMGQGFVDVTVASGIRENRFSQGVSAGDFNADGFPDLYVANLGANRLYQNNGDGTFTDVSTKMGDHTRYWTTSCLLADVNGDSWPDLYAVNYLSGREIFTRVCRDETGPQKPCLPVNFSAAPDQLLLNTGDGRFRNATSTSGVAVANGKGLGIVAADFQHSGRLSLFIANDGVPNFFFVNTTKVRGHPPRFSEQALELGLALNRDGRPEACMGIAAGDADGDGRLDLFVTNFTEESNTLYRQDADGTFVDDTRAAGLADSSFRLLGFGTQFLDADLDGNLDIVLTNGNIDDYRGTSLMYHMPPQFFQNVGEGHFVEIAAESLGSFFQQRYLGRGLARLDWNRDGREDVAISHLEAPAALLTNSTRKTGHFLSVRLCGVKSNRDAVGTIVSLKAGGRSLVRQLTAGSGYQASNEKRLVFGLGTAVVVDQLHIRWPRGLVQKWRDVPADREIMLVEGRRNPIVLRTGK